MSCTPCAVLCPKFVLDTLCYFMWGVSILCGEILTCPMLLLYLGSFSYTPFAVLCGEFVLHAPCCFMWGVSVTHPLLLYVGSFSYTPMLFPVLFYVVSVSYTLCANICLEGVLQTLCCFMFEVCLRHPLLYHVGSFYLMWEFLTCPMVFYVGSFSYMTHAVLCADFLLQTAWCFMWGVSLTRPVLFYVWISLTRPMLFHVGSFLCTLVLFFVGSFSYTSLAVLCVEILLHGPCYFMWGGVVVFLFVFLFFVFLHGPCCFMRGISLTHFVLFYLVVPLTWLVLICRQEVCFPCPMLFDIRNLSYTPYARFYGEIF